MILLNMATSRSALQQTILIFRERGINVKQEDIQAVFDDPETGEDATRWVEECLGETTLLTKEEATLYAKLKSNGTAKSIETSHDLSTIKPILDDDLRTAIASLKASTASIEKQTDALKLQWKHLESLTRQRRDVKTRSAKGQEQLQRRHALEKQHVAVTAEELLQDLTMKLADAQDRTEKAARGVKISTESTLKADDMTLHQLEELADNSELEVFQGKEIDVRTRKLTSRLVDYRTEEIECRLDRIYLETLHESRNGDRGPRKSMKDANALQEELDSLHSEIGVLAEMTVQQEFKDPILKAARSHETQLRAKAEARLSYISRSLDHLLDRCEQKESRLRKFSAHKGAVEAISLSFRKELAPPPITQNKSHVKSKGGSASPLKSGKTYLDETVALAALLRHLGVSVSSGPEGKLVNGELINAVLEKKGKLEEMIRRVDSTVDSSILSPLAASGDTLQLLSDALHADSGTGRPNLSDSGSDAMLGSLEQRIAVLSKNLEGVDISTAHERDKTLERFLEKWADID